VYHSLAHGGYPPAPLPARPAGYRSGCWLAGHREKQARTRKGGCVRKGAAHIRRL